MKSKLINNSDIKGITFDQCLKNTGIYKVSDGYIQSENLVVVCEYPHPKYFGIYDNGEIYPHSDLSGDNRLFNKVGDISVTIEVLE